MQVVNDPCRGCAGGCDDEGWTLPGGFVVCDLVTKRLGIELQVCGDGDVVDGVSSDSAAVGDLDPCVVALGRDVDHRILVNAT